jgi:hypothetical protein
MRARRASEAACLKITDSDSSGVVILGQQWEGRQTMLRHAISFAALCEPMERYSIQNCFFLDRDEA